MPPVQEGMMHQYFYTDPKHYDLAKMREEAEVKARGDFYSDPESSVIHFHKPGEACNGACESYPAEA